jgi:Lrp/AsnC family transcriptional regulator for asnA, asnC and gidA
MPEPKITPVDVGIIDCLSRDARKSFARIAQELRVPESTVRHRLHRLVQHGVLDFAAVANPLRLGYQTWAIIEIQAEPSRTRAVAQRLARESEVYFVGITTGRCDIFAGAVFRSNAEMLEFLTGPLAKIPGITRTSTSTVLEVVKRALTLSVPKALGDEQQIRRRSPRRARVRAAINGRLGGRRAGKAEKPAPPQRA